MRSGISDTISAHGRPLSLSLSNLLSSSGVHGPARAANRDVLWNDRTCSKVEYAVFEIARDRMVNVADQTLGHILLED